MEYLTTKLFNVSISPNLDGLRELSDGMSIAVQTLAEKQKALEKLSRQPIPPAAHVAQRNGESSRPPPKRPVVWEVSQEQLDKLMAAHASRTGNAKKLQDQGSVSGASNASGRKPPKLGPPKSASKAAAQPSTPSAPKTAAPKVEAPKAKTLQSNVPQKPQTNGVPAKTPAAAASKAEAASKAAEAAKSAAAAASKAGQASKKL